MKRIQEHLFVFGLLACIFSAETAHAQLVNNKGERPFSLSSNQIEFIENEGQLTDQYGKLMPEVLYSSDAKGMKCYLTEKGMHFIFSKSLPTKTTPVSVERTSVGLEGLGTASAMNNDTLILQRLDMQFAGANPHPRIEALEMAEGYYNYYLAHCKLSGVHGYHKIIYHGLYPHIDFVIYSKGSAMKYDFIVHPGGDPNVIAMKYSGMDSMLCSSDGKFKICTPLGKMEEDAPYTYQNNDTPIVIPSQFLLSNSELQFRIGNYNRTRDLIIDPVRRIWATYFGGTGLDLMNSTVVDKNDNIYVCGTTESTAGIAIVGPYQATIGGGIDAFLGKFSSSGQRIWATYFGGTGTEYGFGLAIDSSGNLYMSGSTTSTSGIATAGAFQTSNTSEDAVFLGKFSSSGLIQWATYFSGNSSTLVFSNHNVCCDRQGNIFLCGVTVATSGIATPGVYQSAKISINPYTGFLAKFSSSGSRLWATYFGGENEDEPAAVSSDPAGNVILAGMTASFQNISTPGAHQPAHGGTLGSFDGFIAKFSGIGSILWSTYYGQSSDVRAVCTDTAGNIYAAGYTNSAAGIATPGSYQPALVGGTDGMVLKFAPAGVLQWGTYYGAGFEICYDIVTNSRELVVTGETQSTTGIVTADAYQLHYANTFSGTGFDGFLSKFTISGFLKWGTYYGGLQDDQSEGCTVDHTGSLIMVGRTSSIESISSPGAFKENADGGGADYDAFIVKFCDVIPPALNISKNKLCLNSIDTITLNGGYSHVYWYDDTIPLAWLTDSVRFILPDTLRSGKHHISVEVVNPSDCTANDTLSLIISTGPVLHFTRDTFICAGKSIAVGGDATGGIPPYTYKWLSVLGLSSTTVSTPVATPKKTTVYTVIVTDSIGCQFVDSVTVHVVPLPTPDITGLTSVCPQTDAGYISHGTPGDKYTWSLNGGGTLAQSSNPDSVNVLWKTNGKWKLTISRTNAGGCTGDTTITIDVNSTLTPVLTPAGPISICEGDSLVLHASKGYAGYSWSDGSTLDSLFVRQGGTYTLSVTDKNGCSGSSSVTVSVIPLPSLTIIPDATHLCPGGVIHLSVTGSSGRYAWNTGDSTSSITVSKPGTYSVDVTTSSGCKASSPQVTITLDSSFHPIITGPVSICQGQAGVLYSIPNNSGSSYQWMITNGSITNGQGTSGISVQWNSSSIGSGTLMVVETTSGGCLDTGLITITIDASLHPVITGAPLAFCAGDSVTLDAGSGYTSYQWSKDGLSIPGATSEFLRVGQSGSYRVDVSNSGGCSGTSAAISVTVFPAPAVPVITQIDDTLFCNPLSASYQWFVDGNLLPGETNQRIIITRQGKYSVTITDGNGCSGSSTPFGTGVKATAIVRVGKVSSVDPGNPVEIPIELVASTDLIPSKANHYVGILRYDGSMLIPTGSRNGTLGSTSAIGGSHDRIVNFEGFSAPMTVGTLQWIQSKAMLGLDSCTKLVIDTFYWTDADVDVTRENGEFCESGICIAGGSIRLIDASGKLGMSAIHPNPASNRITVEYDLLETGRTQLILSDAIGRTVRIVTEDEQRAGHYKTDIQLDDISSGYYQVLLKTPSQIVSRSFVVQK